MKITRYQVQNTIYHDVIYDMTQDIEMCMTVRAAETPHHPNTS